MSTALIYDILIILIALIFIGFGWYRGLILSLANLVVLICACIGANIVSDVVTPLATPMITPTIESYLTSQFAERAQIDSSATLATLLEDGKLSILTPYLDHELITSAQDTLVDFASETISEIANLVASGILGTIIWTLAFLVLSLMLHLLFHALDLVAKLPVLSTLNATGGIVVGAIQGLLVIYIILAVAGYFNLLPSATEASETYVYQYVAAISPLSLLG